MVRKQSAPAVKLKWSREDDWFAGEAQLSDGTKLELQLTAEGPSDRAKLPEQTAAAFALLDGKLAKIKTAAAARLLSLHNDVWNKGKPMTRDAFAKRLVVRSLTRYDDGSWELELADGGLFRGHTVLVSLSKKGQVTDASIAG